MLILVCKSKLEETGPLLTGIVSASCWEGSVSDMFKSAIVWPPAIFPISNLSFLGNVIEQVIGHLSALGASGCYQFTGHLSV